MNTLEDIMKFNLIKKFASVVLIAAMLLTGCARGTAKTGDEMFTVGISQLVEHPALDAARQGFMMK